MAQQPKPVALYLGPDCHCCNRRNVRVQVEDRPAVLCPQCDLTAFTAQPPTWEEHPPG